MNTALKGHVYLVGAGPGDPDLLTIRALHILESADAILHDDLVPPAILALAATTALIVNVGKRCGAKNITQPQIHALMIEMARKGLSVVRLKSGDPLIFGRAAEEMDALRAAAIPFAVVPGVTAAFAAAAALGISLTDRSAASGVQFSTGHQASYGDRPRRLPKFVPDSTQVVYMPGRSLVALAQQWLDEGADPGLPCVIVSHAAQPDQSIQATTLGSLHLASAVGAPSLLLAGWAFAATLRAAASESGADAVRQQCSVPSSTPANEPPSIP